MRLIRFVVIIITIRLALDWFLPLSLQPFVPSVYVVLMGVALYVLVMDRRVREWYGMAKGERVLPNNRYQFNALPNFPENFALEDDESDGTSLLQ